MDKTNVLLRRPVHSVGALSFVADFVSIAGKDLVILNEVKNPIGQCQDSKRSPFGWQTVGLRPRNLAALPMNRAWALSPFVIQSDSEGSHEIRREIPRKAANERMPLAHEFSLYRWSGLISRRSQRVEVNALHPRYRAKQFIGLFQASRAAACSGSRNDKQKTPGTKVHPRPPRIA
jgi:hypothetical protein